MKLNDRTLYHQIHPAKLATDWLTTPIALYFFWQHRLVSGLVATLLPPIAASAIIIRYSDLEPSMPPAMIASPPRWLREWASLAQDGDCPEEALSCA